MRYLFIGILLLTFTLGFSAYATYPRISLSVDDIRSPVFSAKAIQVSLVGQRLTFHLGEIIVQGETWHDLELVCGEFQLTASRVSCTDGRLFLPNSAPLPIVLSFSSDKKKLDIEIKPTASESWKFFMHWDEGVWHSQLSIVNGQATHILPWLPDAATMPTPSKGEVNGTANLNGDADGVSRVVVALRVDKLAFSDSSGLHAGENVELAINVDATYARQKNQWQWRGDANWMDGEVFWQPLYFAGSGHRINLNGTIIENNIHLHTGNLALVDIGEFDFSGVLARPGNELIDFDLQASNLKLSTLFDQVLRPFLENTAFAEMQLAGHADIAGQYCNRETRFLKLDLYDAAVVDRRTRFAFHDINAHIPWKIEGVTNAEISFQSGQVLQIPLGAVRIPLEINQFDFKIPQLVLPVLDGEFKLENFHASQQAGDWHWKFSGELLPVSMEKLTEALQIQQMHGTLSGVIPEVSYAQSKVMVGGTLLFDIFDGIVTARNLRLVEPLGLAPHLAVDLEMRNLDLDLLTRTFSFGNIQGRVDVDMHNLELANWQPVRFDANLASSSGSYPRRISQAAIENVSALGGESAVAAIQRSFLRFFDDFTYVKIGWRCSLRNNVCQMEGIESDYQLSESQGYTIVQGGGIPAITVMGYNRRVDWQALINRLKRVTQGNDPVIQ